MNLIPEDKVDEAAKLFIEWSRSVDEDEFDATFKGLEGVLDILAKAMIVPLDTKERLCDAIGRMNEEEAKRDIEEFFK
ncbi:hypothetical protein D9M71_496790 [compost metagenome]